MCKSPISPPEPQPPLLRSRESDDFPHTALRHPTFGSPHLPNPILTPIHTVADLERSYSNNLSITEPCSCYREAAEPTLQHVSICVSGIWLLLPDKTTNHFFPRCTQLHCCVVGMSVSACKKLFFLTPGGQSWLIPLTLCLSMELRKSKSVWSEIPPWTIRIFPSITVAMGRRLKTSWNSWRISRPWVCKQARTVI